MKNPQARKKRHARTGPKLKCWRCGSTRRLVLVNGRGARIVACVLHLAAAQAAPKVTDSRDA